MRWKGRGWLGCMMLMAWFGLQGLALAETVKVGVVVPFTGPVARAGQSEREGLDLAAEEINTAGGIKGVGKIELIYEDGQCDPTASVNATTKLVFRDKVAAVVGAICSSATLASMKVTEKAKTPHLTALSSAASITAQGNRWIFRLQVTSARTTARLVDLAVKELKLKRLAVLQEAGDFGKEAAKGFEDRLKEHGMKPVASETFSLKDRDFSPQLLKIKELKPDAIAYFGMAEPVALAMKQARQFGIQATKLSLDPLITPGFIDLVGDAAEGVAFPVPFFVDDPNPMVQEFVKKFKAKKGKMPDDIHARGYHLLYVLASAVERARSLDGEKIRDALSKLSYKGVLGTTHFNANGDDQRDFILLTIKNRTFLPYRP